MLNEMMNAAQAHPLLASASRELYKDTKKAL